jgi:hypothetical protein
VKFNTHTGQFPGVPHLLDMPGPDHRVVLDFAGAAIEKGTLESPEAISKEVNKIVPAIKGIRYSNLTNTQKPTARVVVDLPEAVGADPRVVKLDESSVTISLGDAVVTATSSDPASNATANASDSSVDGSPVPSAVGSAPAATGDTAAQASDAAGSATSNVPGAIAQGSDMSGSEAPAPAASAAPVAKAPAASNSGTNWDWGGATGSAMVANGATHEGSTAATPASAPADAAAAPAPSADSVDGLAPRPRPMPQRAMPLLN